ncbi:hypothetical protein AEQU3_03526 [Aequorivita antarctica]|nr:hypothetical protein AEQU3_03526 [Aequorivita antarctica]
MTKVQTIKELTIIPGVVKSLANSGVLFKSLSIYRCICNALQELLKPTK